MGVSQVFTVVVLHGDLTVLLLCFTCYVHLNVFVFLLRCMEIPMSSKQRPCEKHLVVKW
jgi:hypothetical protein